MTFTPHSDVDEGEESVDRSTENTFRTFEKLTAVTTNAEFLKTAVENLSANQGKSSNEVSAVLQLLSAQVHDISVRLGENPGFVGSYHDSAWNGISVVQGNVEELERKVDKSSMALSASSIKKLVAEGVQDAQPAVGSLWRRSRSG